MGEEQAGGAAATGGGGVEGRPANGGGGSGAIEALLDPSSLIHALHCLDVTLQKGITDLSSTPARPQRRSNLGAGAGMAGVPRVRTVAPASAGTISNIHADIVEEDEDPDKPPDHPPPPPPTTAASMVTPPRRVSPPGMVSLPPGMIPPSAGIISPTPALQPLPVNGAAGIVRRRIVDDFEPVQKVDPAETRRFDKVTIYAHVVFLKLGEIDTVAEKFNADAFIQARWREPNLDGQHKSTQFELCSKDVFWDPKLYVENAMGEPKEAVWQIASFNEKGEATVSQRRRVKGTFFERMELMQYPFDTQDLTLTLTTERGDQEVDLQADMAEVSSVNIQSFVDEQEWHLHKHINTWTRVSTNAYQNSKNKHPSVSISCKATRRSQFFLWNIILVMVFICSLVFATFSVNLVKPENRIQLTFILLLSNITFKFTVNQTLPKVSYLTYLDKYILSSMAILCLVCVWHAVVPLLSYDMAMARRADNCAFGVLAGLYVFFNLIFFTWSRCLVSRRSREYNKKDAKQKEILTHMEENLGDNIVQLTPI